MIKLLSKVIDRLFVVAGAILLLQAPLFIQAYRQHLAGHVAELTWQVDEMQQIATESGKTLDDFVQKFVQNTDKDFSRQGKLMEKVISRQRDFSIALSRLNNASILSRPFVFLWNYNHKIASTTLSMFSLGVPLTFEGVVYALVGMLIGFAVFAFLRKIVRTVFGIKGSTS